MSCYRQHGIALIISMILLAVITLLSISAMRASNIDSRIAANFQHKHLSFQAAESALTRLTSDQPQITIPDSVLLISANPDYIAFSASEGQPAVSADLDLAFIRNSLPGEYKISGYSINIRTLIYQADAYGEVDGSNTRTHNRATLLRIDSQH